MSNNLLKCTKNLKIIRNLPLNLRKKALAKFACNIFYYKAIKEIAKNIINKNIKLKNFQKIKTHWKNIVDISGVKKLNKRNKKIKKELVIQSGGWIWSVLPIVISLLQSMQK